MTTIKTFAEEFASLLAARVPELGFAGKPDGTTLEQRRCLCFRVPCPSPAVKSPLVVTVSPSEITLELLDARSCFTSPQEAAEQIRDLIDEVVIVETWYSGPNRCFCAFVVVSALPRAPYPISGVTNMVRRSWRGTHDINSITSYL